MADTNAAHAAYDVAVIGGGPGGYVAAIRAAQLGRRTAVIEREALGGICVNWGCIPNRALLRAAEVLTLFRRAAEFGISLGGEVTADYAAALERSRRIAATQGRGLQFLMRKNKIDVIQGTGRLVARDRIRVTHQAESREVRAKHVVIATGSRVQQIPGIEVDGGRILTSREVWHAADLPRRIVIAGGGPIGVEFAQVFLSYGCEVTLVEMLPRLIPMEDAEMSDLLARALARRGLKVLAGARVEGAAQRGGEVVVRVRPVSAGRASPANAPSGPPLERRTDEGGGGAAPDGTHELVADRLLLAPGFVPNTDHLGLEEVGIRTERGFIQVDGELRTSVPNVYAVGDVTGRLRFADVASAQGHAAAEAIAGRPTIRLDYNAMPRCTYTTPQVAALGLTEQQAREQYGEIKVGRFPVRPNGKAQALGELDGMVKIIGHARTGEILGAHLIGPEVAELIGEFSVARILESTAEEIARAVRPHPTLSETIAEAAMNVTGAAINI